MRAFQFSLIFVLLIALNGPQFIRADEAPITEGAKALLAEVQTAYDNLKSLEIAGHVTMTLGLMPGREPRRHSAEFRGLYAAPNKYKYVLGDPFEKPGDLHGPPNVRGCNGSKIYPVYKTPDSRLTTIDVPPEKISESVASKLGSNFAWDGCPPLFFAAYKNGVARVTRAGSDNTVAIYLGESVTIDLKVYPTVIRKVGSEELTVTLAIDPGTKLVRRMIKRTVHDNGEVNEWTLDYSTVKPNAAVKDEDFEWTAPPVK